MSAIQRSKAAGPDLPTLFALFPGPIDLPTYEEVAAEAVPEPYRTLLVHEHHMTVTVEAHHGGPVDVRVMQTHRQGPWYARKILLVLSGTEQVVQFGIMRINLDLCSPAVREAILREDTPLGRILIQHDVLRRIEPTAFLRVVPNQVMREWFGLAQPRPTYGRLALIHYNHQPAVELLEIVTPENGK